MTALATEADPIVPTRARAALIRRIALVAVGLTWLGPFTMDAYSPGFPAIAREFGVGDWAVQLTLTASLAGLVVGQLISAPVADRFGRRMPLIVALGVFLLTTLACALAPNVESLVAARFFQGAAAAIGVATSRSVGRDVLEPRRLAPFFSQLAAVTSIAPVVGPLVGSALMTAGGSWRWIFALIGFLGFVVLVIVVLALPETHPDRIDPALLGEERAEGAADAAPASAASAGAAGEEPHVAAATVAGLEDVGAVPALPKRPGVRALFADRAVLASALAIGLSSGALLSYLAGTSLLLQDRYGLSPSQYALVFALNAVGLLIAAQANGRLVRRIRPGVIATVASAVLAADGVALVLVFLGGAPLGVVLGLLALIVFCAGFIGSNVLAIGMSVDRRSASTASALLGVAQNLFGALSAPLVGLGASALVPSQAWLVAGYGVATLVAVLAVGGSQFRSRLAASGPAPR